MKIVGMASLAVLLTACTGTFGPQLPTNSVLDAATKLQPAHSTLADCSYAIRDLSVPWHSRSYWCHPDGDSNTQIQRNSLLPTDSSTQLSQGFPIVESNSASEIDAVYVTSQFQISTKNRGVIPFAQGATRLGPEGQLRAVALTASMSEASRVLLRSYLNPDDPEHFPITRAIAVREALQTAGLKAPITILHPRPGSGRSIEVIAR